MQCPKCGTENPDDAQVCTSCSCDLSAPTTAEPTPKPKTSKLVIASILLAVLAAVLTILLDPTLGLIVALFGVFGAIASIATLRRSDKKLIGKSISVGAGIFLALVILVFSYWRIDAASIPSDYTIADIRSAPAEYSQSYELLLGLADANDQPRSAPAIGLSEEDVNALGQIYQVCKEHDFNKISTKLRAEEQIIVQIWQNAEKGRDIISKLDSFTEIADLTEPNSMELDLRWAKNLRNLLQLHRVYVCLQTSLGNEQVALEELITLRSVLNKLSLNSRSTITRLVCIAGLAETIMTANFIANNPRTSQQAIQRLWEKLRLSRPKYISVKNSIVFDYLTVKNCMRNLPKETNLRWDAKYSIFWPLKLNSSLRLYRNICDRWIAEEAGQTQLEEFRVWPVVYPNLPVELDSQGRFPWYYTGYNPVGSLLIAMMVRGTESVLKLKTRLQIHYDLLGIVLNKRLGKQVSLKARAYSDEYII
ncbi:MAG: zinc ribbon domain-containing protein, partial [Planctomycetota bacterium]